ncbi:MAG: AAA family ATPase [Candidatus Aenigmatarchaeota archaeon]
MNEEIYEQILEEGRRIKERIIEELKGELPIILEKDLENIQTSKISWIVENYIPEKSIVLFAGKRSSYKTWGALYFALSIAAGVKVFEKFETKKGFVLYIDEENGIDELKRKVQMIKKGMGLNEGLDNLAFLSFEGLKIDQRNIREKLTNFLKNHNPCVIFVDTLRRIITCEENDATEMNRVFTDYLRPIQEEYNVTWVLIHHLRKGVSGRKPDDILDELRGSSEITNVADSIIVFDRPPRLDNRFVLRHCKARRTKELEPQIIELKWDDKNGALSFECLGAAEEILDSVDICMKAIMVWLEENGVTEFTTKEIKEEIKKEGFSKATIERAISTLVQQGKIIRIKRGHYRRIVETLGDFSNASKPQLPQDANKTKIESKEENINNLKLYNNEAIDASENLNRLNTIKSEAIEAIDANEVFLHLPEGYYGKCSYCGENTFLEWIDSKGNHLCSNCRWEE